MINVNQITSRLASMPDKALQQYAAMHKNDPYTMALALSESNRRKQMRQGAQMQAPQQPKVVDQEIAQMSQPMPEDTGIGQLPAPNMERMAEGGIVAFEDGGAVPGYAGGVFTGKPVSTYIDKYAQEYGVDPAVLSQIIKVESQGKTTAKNPKSTAHGAGQLLDEMWKKMGGGDRADAETQVRNAAKLLRSNTDNFKKANGREPSVSEAYVTWVLGDSTGRAVLKADPNASVEDVIKKADPELGDKIIKSNASIFKNKSVGDVTQWAESKTRLPSLIPVGTAQAASAAPQDQGISALNRANDPAYAASPGGRTQAQADALFKKQMQDVEKFFAGAPQDQGVAALAPDVASQIPGQSRKAPEYKDTNTYFGSLADKAGIPQEFQRNFSNTLNALGGWTAPVAGAAKVGQAGSVIARELEPTAAMIQKAEQAAAVANTPRILPPAKAGLDVLDEASAATRAAAENARRMAQLEQDRKAATGAAQSIEAATKTASIADKTAKEIALAQDAARLNQAKMTGAAQGLATMQAVDKVGGIPDLPVAQPAAEPPVGAYTDEATRLAQRYPAPEETKPEDEGIAKLMPEEAKKNETDWGNLALMFGLNLLAGDSPNALTNVGKAGLATLNMKQAEEKTKSEAEYRRAMAKHYTMPSASVQELEWARDPKNMALLRQIAQAKADPKASAQEALAFLKDAGILLKETDPVLYNVLRNKALGGAVPQVQNVEGTRS
jgi:hypothetical protein